MIILASKSPARAELLRRAGVTVSIQGSGVDEAPLKARWLLEGATPLEVAERLAAAKADAVAQRAHPGGSWPWVIGADQTAEFQGRLLDKAESVAQALDRLRAMRGLPHQLHSAVTLMNSVQTWSCVSTATLHVRDFGDVWLDAYAAAAGAALTETVGGYELESVGVQLFDRIDGDYFAILGLPLTELLGALRRFDALPG